MRFPSLATFAVWFAVSSLAACAASGTNAQAGPDGSSTPGGPGGGPTGPGAKPTDAFGDQLCGGAFCWQDPRLGNNTLNGVHAIADGDDEIVFAVGAGGVVLRGRSDGWAVASTPSSAALNGVFALAKDDVWAVGEAGAIVHYDGKSFTVVPTSVKTTLRGVWAAATDDAWAIGDEGIAIHWDGKTWKEAGRAGDEMHAVWGSSADDVWFVGGTLNVNTIAHWDGAFTTSHGGLSGEGLYAIHGTASDDIWAVGEYGHVLHYDGKGWGFAGRAGEREARLLSVHATDSGDVWIGNATEVYRRKAKGSGSEFSPWTVKDGPGATALAMAGGANGDTWTVGTGGVIRSVGSDGTYRDELANAALSSIAIVDEKHAVGVFTSGPKAQSARVFDGTHWKEVDAITNTDNETLNVGMTTDGTAVVMHWTYPADMTTVTTYANGSARTLPATKGMLYPFTVAGSSANDVYIGWQHWNGSTWAPLGGKSTGQIAAMASMGPNAVWAVGVISSREGPEQPWLGRVEGETITGTTVTSLPASFRPTSIAATGTGDAFVAGTLTDYTKPQDRGFVYYPQKPMVYRVSKSDTWTEQKLPDVKWDYDGVGMPTIGAHGDRAFVAFQGTAGVAANGYALEDGAWAPSGFPATNVKAVTTTASATWIAAEGLLKTK